MGFEGRVGGRARREGTPQEQSPGRVGVGEGIGSPVKTRFAWSFWGAGTGEVVGGKAAEQGVTMA